MFLKKLFLFLSAAFLFTLASCGAVKVPELEYDFKTDTYLYKNDETEIRYELVLGHLQAREIYTEPFAYHRVGKTNHYLYEIPGIEPQKWISEHLKDIVRPLLFKTADEEEPTLTDFETVKIHFTETREITIAAGEIDYLPDVNLIVTDFLHNEPVPIPDNFMFHFTFYFESEKYPWAYYVLEYFIDENNYAYLFDRWWTDGSGEMVGRFVPCSVNVFGRTPK